MKLSEKIQNRSVMHLKRRIAKIRFNRPVVTFTFDDFPVSAANAGAEILESMGCLGTYYACLGMLNQESRVGKICSRKDLERLLSAGHEIGCHTWSHKICRKTSLKNFLIDAKRNVEQASKSGIGDFLNFAYPGGSATLLAKWSLNDSYSTCRSTVAGVHTDYVDLNFLRANRLYENTALEQIKRLLSQNRDSNGWLIFYTHDVSVNPTKFGCTPPQLEFALRLAVESGADIMPVKNVIDLIQSSS